MLVAALDVAIVGCSFAVGIAYVSRWWSIERQGAALGIFGVGNVGAAVEAIENRFATQVRFSIPLASATGLWMTRRLVRELAFWSMETKVFIWAHFMAIVFVVEPLARERIAVEAAQYPGALLRRLSRAHFVLLAAPVTIFGAVACAHGGLFG